MWKSLGASLFANVIVFFAGWVTQGSGFSVEILALLFAGSGLMGFAFVSHRTWCDDMNYSDRVLVTLVPDRAYEVLDRGKVGNDYVSFLYDLVLKKSVVYRGIFIPSGFYEDARGDDAYFVPNGKSLVEGDIGDCVFVPTTKKAQSFSASHTSGMVNAR